MLKKYRRRTGVAVVAIAASCASFLPVGAFLLIPAAPVRTGVIPSQQCAPHARDLCLLSAARETQVARDDGRDIETEDADTRSFYNLAERIRLRLSGAASDPPEPPPSYFVDCASTARGEAALLSLLPPEDTVLRDGEDGGGGPSPPAAVLTLHGLALMGMQFGNVGRDVAGSAPGAGDAEEALGALRRFRAGEAAGGAPEARDDAGWSSRIGARKSHLFRRAPGGGAPPPPPLHEMELARALLATLKRRRSPKGARDLLVATGAWAAHEDLGLLRNGWPLRFTKEEEEAAAAAAETPVYDADALLGIRKDLRRLKVYVIDSASTNEVDDGVSLEAFEEGGVVRQRIWIHIADAGQYAPPGSALWAAARRRGTSLYLPHNSFGMFPSSVGAGVMGLNGGDCRALSLGCEIDSDGALLPDTITITPSIVRVTYRLTYVDADEMFAEGSAYAEEWQLGALLQAAQRRRAHRIARGSAEAAPYPPVPRGVPSVRKSRAAGDGERMEVRIRLEVSHNAGANETAAVAPVPGNGRRKPARVAETEPVSPSALLVTEAMILAGEALGRWGGKVGGLALPYRRQPAPDQRAREFESEYLKMLEKTDAGGSGLCATWYARRFNEPASVGTEPGPHAGIGLEAYVQWSSPIRRYCDLQVHCAVKRHLRRAKVLEILAEGGEVPGSLTDADLGVPLSALLDGRDDVPPDADINYGESTGLQKGARQLQNKSQAYWMLEFVRRLIADLPEGDTDGRTFRATVLGCTDSKNLLYVVYFHDLGLEKIYRSERGNLEPGDVIWLALSGADPGLGILRMSAVATPVGFGRRS